MKLSDLEKVRLLAQRRVKLVEDRRLVTKGEILLIDLSVPSEPKGLKVMAMTGTEEGKLFEKIVETLLGDYTRRIEEIDAELVALGVTP